MQNKVAQLGRKEKNENILNILFIFLLHNLKNF